MEPIHIRPAARSDAHAIRRLILRVGINPLGLHWQRFLVAVDSAGVVIGCGQIKQHAGGLRELASIAVAPAWQRRGIGQALVTRLLENAPLPLYLMCAEHRETFYLPFGFRRMQMEEMPTYFRRMALLVRFANRVTGSRRELRVMVKPLSSSFVDSLP